MGAPTTAAGRKFLDMHATCAPMSACTMHGDLPAAVAAIEVEAHAAELRRLREALPPACEARGGEGDLGVCTVHGEFFFEGRCEDWDRGVRDVVLALLDEVPRS